MARPVAVLAGGLQLGGERDQRAGERVHLVGRQHRCRPPGGARPRRAPARGPASASSRAAIPREGSSRPASISASAASSAARRAVPGARAARASSPSSTNGSRANSSARFRSSPETGAASTTELLSATVGRPLQGRTAGHRTRRSRSRAESARSALRIRRSVRACERRARRVHPERPASYYCSTRSPEWRLPPLPAMRRLGLIARPARPLAVAGCSSSEPGESRPARRLREARRRPRGAGRVTSSRTSCSAAGKDASRSASRRCAAPGGGQQVGLVVRSLPLRVPLLPEAGGQAGQEVAFLGVNSQDNDDDAQEFLGEFPLPFPSYKDPTWRWRAVFNGVRPSPPPPSTTGRATSPTCTRAATPARRSWPRTSSATLADLLDVRTARTHAGARGRPRPARARVLRGAGRVDARPTATAATGRPCTWWRSTRSA